MCQRLCEFGLKRVLRLQRGLGSYSKTWERNAGTTREYRRRL